ncbi:MAG TPA: hypothetical protein VFP65_02545 [Anaeromyxobacteraceae bacterium]|nr:hypothetical protein [Anaeromyxobacteraceae bacterium]
MSSLLALPRAGLAGDDAAARAAAASDPQYSGHLTSWSGLIEMKPTDVMHMVDTGEKGHVTRDEFTKFQDLLFRRIDRNHDGKIDAEEWMGTGMAPTAAAAH